MRILFLVPSKQHKSTAGSRIRYDRIRAKSAYFDVAVQSLDEVSREELAACDVCVFSKTYSVGAVAVAETLRARGVVVGIDLFDDYFSQEDDPRLTPFRSWLRRFAPVFQFGLCSTPTMRRVIGHLAPDLPVHIVPDPCPEIDPGVVTASVRRSLDRARATGVIDVLWFGIGSNPFFPVGLQDLAAHAWSLADLAAGRYRISLRVLTDDASLTPAALARLKSLPVPFATETWTVERERQALEEALVAFIPVNGQSFSRAKSPNRALTAISAGAQVLSPGYPLYGELDALIYARAADLLADVERGECRVGPDRIGEIQRVAGSVSDLDPVLAELARFLTPRVRSRRSAEAGEAVPAEAPPSFLARLPRFLPRPSRPARPSDPAAEAAEAGATGAILFGLDQEWHTARAASVAGLVSVKSPYARLERAYDVRLDLSDDRQLGLGLRPEMVRYLAEPLRARLSEPRQVGGIPMLMLEQAPELRLDRPLAVSPSEGREIVYETAAYRSALADLVRVFRCAFPSLGVRIAGLSAYQDSGSARDGAY